jgi:hypothetical protein
MKPTDKITDERLKERLDELKECRDKYGDHNLDYGDYIFSNADEEIEILAELQTSRQTLAGMNNFHPRAMKLMRKRKNFIVIAEDEPYFRGAYDMIRSHEATLGKWTAGDEIEYHFSIERNTALIEELKEEI